MLQARSRVYSAGEMMKIGTDAETAPKWREIRGFRLCQGFLDRPEQEAMVAALRGVVAAAPLVRPLTPGGKAM